MADHNELGLKGEEKAVAYLAEHGFLIRECNWRCGRIEIDIIAAKAGLLVFVEVKSRSTHYFGYPENAVHKMKQRAIAKAAEVYVKKNKHHGSCRFDIISILFGSNKEVIELEHITDAFYPYSGF